MARLLDHTVVTNPDGGMPVRLWAGDPLPDWAIGLVGDHLLDEPAMPIVPAVAEVPERQPGAEPPRGGPGSGRDAWVAYTIDKGHADLITPEIKQGEIIAALIDLGVIENK